MSKTAQVTITASVIGDGVQYSNTAVYSNAAGNAQPIQTINVASGTNTVTVPTGLTQGILFMPPPNSSVTKEFTTGAPTTVNANWYFLPITSGSFTFTANGVEVMLALLV